MESLRSDCRLGIQEKLFLDSFLCVVSGRVLFCFLFAWAALTVRQFVGVHTQKGEQRMYVLLGRVFSTRFQGDKDVFDVAGQSKLGIGNLPL